MMLADALAAWNAWTSVTPIAATARAGLARVAIPQSISPGVDGSYPDLRVVDPNGNETPYALDPGRPVAEYRTVDLIDTGFVQHAGTQAVADLGPGGTLENSITLSVDSESRPSYFEDVAVDASDDRMTWREVLGDGLIYRVARDDGKGNQTIALPPTRSRWLRLRILDPHAPFPLTGASVAASAAPAPSLVPVPYAALPAPSASPHAQAWIVHAPVAVRPAAVSFAVTGQTFARGVTIEASDDGTTWNEIGSDTIARYPDGAAHLTVGVDERTSAYVRITIDNGNDAPLRNVRPSLKAVAHTIVFEAATGGSYRMLSGNAGAGAPTYDLSARLAHEQWSVNELSAGTTAANPSFADQRPIGERFPWLITIVVIAVAAMLGILAIRTIRTAERTD